MTSDTAFAIFAAVCLLGPVYVFIQMVRSKD